MKRTMIALLALMGLWMLFGLGDTSAQTVSNSSYTAVPPFAGTNLTPNVLILLDNSGSMGRRANCDVATGGDFTTCSTFVAATTYGGLFDPMKCYTYDGVTDNRFESPTTKATISTACAVTEWDGNFLNWVSLRRIDMAKVALIGGSCAAARNADGTCPATGTPSKITIEGASQFAYSSGGHVATPAVPTGAGANNANGRVPTAVQILGATPANLYFHVMGTDGGTTLIGSFCVDNDTTKPAENAADCSDNDGAPNFTEQRFRIRVTVDTEPTGVIQEVGVQVRFGLMEFLGVSYFADSSADQGGQVLVPIGSKQRKVWNGSTVTTYSNNTVAMVHALEDSFNQGNTPMAEALYEAARYFAQIGSAFHTGTYVYPIGFSPGVGLATNGIGSFGTGEEKVLTGTETCPTGYVADVCGRDPYYFGSNHTPAWASPSSQAPCCDSFVIIFTDGDSQQDAGVPAALQDLAHTYHGQHCTGTSGTIHAPNGTCNINIATPTATWLSEHKTDFANSGTHYLDDVAYWMHTRDLRQATIPDISVAGHDLPGKQNITVYSFFAFAQAINREFLLQTARQGGFEDLDGDNVPDCDTAVLTNPCEWDKKINATGESGRDNIPDTYYESSDVSEMKEHLAQALSSILQKSTSGTSLSVLATSTTGEGALYQSFFFPKVTEGLVNVYWIGYTQALFLDTFGNLREDTDADGRLVYKNDKIIKTRYNAGTGSVDVDLFTDTSPSPDGDGVADSTTPSSTIALKDIKPIWEGGKTLALRNEATLPRKILTWLDLDNDSVVDSGEQIEFKSASPDNRTNLRPYLRAADTTESDKIIRWIRGETITGYRNREITVSGSTKTWRFGDTIHSTPTVVGAPRERFDVLYGDISYSLFFQTYKDRRQVAYVGANDGMMHAFNVGFYNAGDDTSTSTAVEHGWFTTQRVAAPFVSSTPALGHELWAFIPQELLPQLKFLTQGDYQHVYYVDQKPKITDARIFCDSTTPAPTSPNCVTGQGSGSSHPNGWGTILIGSFRLGGSCQNCTTGGANLSVTADFNYDGDTVDAGDTRSFRSAYFALDVTDPELDPKLLWTFTDPDLGLTLSYPSMARLRPAGGDKTDNSDARWFMVVGSGPTGYDVGSVQTGKLFVVDIVKYAAARTLNTTYYVFPTPKTCGTASPNSECSVIGNPVTVDTDFDYRADILYFGNMICNATAAPCNGNQGSGTPAAGTWKGKLYRLTLASSTNTALGTETDPCGWGIGSSSCVRTPSVLLGDFACSGSCTGANLVGPVSTAVNVAQDDANKIWVYWGTGRYFANADKTNADQQHFFGVKDLVPTSGCTQSTATNCEKKDLMNVSSASVCVVGTTTGTGTCDTTNQVSGVTGVDSFDSSGGGTNPIVGAIQNKDGWYTTLPDSRERALSTPAVIGGLVFFPTFVPENDLCSSTGSSFLYALFYKSGTAYKESVIGTETSGSNTNVKRRTALGDPGLASGVAVHMGAQGSGASGSGGGGCQGQMTANIQSSTGSIGQTCIKTAGAPWSYYVSWVSQRE